MVIHRMAPSEIAKMRSSFGSTQQGSLEGQSLSQKVGDCNLRDLPQTLQCSGRPEPGEYADYAQTDIDLVEGDDAVEVLIRQGKQTVALFQELGEPNGNVTYAPGKWTVKQVLGHLADDERIFAYRALCIARGDSRPLPGFDENDYAAAARFENHSLADLLADFEAVRHASITLFRGLDAEAWLRKGIINGYSASPRGLAFHIAGHELHHLRILRERYLPLTALSFPP